MGNIKQNDNELQILRAKKLADRAASIGWKLFRTFILFGLSFVILYPLLYMLSMTFRPSEQIYDPTVIWVPKSLTLENLKNAWELMDYPNAFKLSMLANVVSAFLQIIVCSFAGYGFARFKFKGQKLFFMLVLFTIVIPSQIITTPTYMTFRTLGVLDTVFVFYLPAALGAGIKSGLFIFIFRQFYRGLPRELEDAAAIDGCGFFKCYYRVIMPNAGSVFVMTIMLSLMWYWNDYFTSSMYFSDNRTVTVALVNLEHSATVLTGDSVADPFDIIVLMQAGSLMAILPILLVYIVLQRQFVQGVERSGIVG